LLPWCNNSLSPLLHFQNTKLAVHALVYMHMGSYVSSEHNAQLIGAHGAWQVKAEKPPWYLSVIAGAVLRSLNAVSSRAADFLGYLTKGQLPPMHISLTSFQESFVLDGTPPCRTVYAVRHICIPVLLAKGIYQRVLHGNEKHQTCRCSRQSPVVKGGTNLHMQADDLPLITPHHRKEVYGQRCAQRCHVHAAEAWRHISGGGGAAPE
jgi:hypothetical protein